MAPVKKKAIVSMSECSEEYAKCLRFSSIVKTICLCLQLNILLVKEAERSMAYLTPQEGQKRLLQWKGTNLAI